VIDSLRDSGTRFLHFDLGDFMDTRPRVKEVISRFIWNTLADQGVAATTPGSRELSEWDLYREFIDSKRIPVVSSNLTLEKDGREQPVGVPYAIVDVQGIKVGVIGLIGSKEFVNANVPASVHIEYHDPLEVATDLVPRVRKKADLVVLLSQMSTSDTDQLLQSVSGIDIALYGQRPAFVKYAHKVGDTITNQTSVRGQILGYLVTIVSPEGQVVDFGSRNGPLTKDWADDEETARRVKEVEAQEKKITDAAREQSKEEFESRVPTEKYLGGAICQRCHQKEYDQWASTPHAHAFATLQTDKGKEFDSGCVGCHVTGWDQPAGYTIQSTGPDLKNVQCEACHGPGTEHDRSSPTKVGKEICLNCHTGRFGEGFDFEKAIQSVVH
jgi:2',3'-cyclic-nucleotide 2'-phosphodiesterase (5'-nucleotidase family)